MSKVWFIYPETANVRLEDMNLLFGDATSVMGTPASRAENASLFSGRGDASPVPSLSLGEHGADSAIPGLDIDPPNVQIKDGKPILSRQNSSSEGLGGWISNLAKRAQSGGEAVVGSVRSSRGSIFGSYKPVGQGDD